MDKYGWIIAVERAAHLDTEVQMVFTVNLVRPWCDEEDPLDPRGPRKEDATGKTGGLWFPWTWDEGVAWTAYGQFEVAGKLTWNLLDTAAIDIPGAAKALADPKGIGAAIEKEIAAASRSTEYPLSRALEDLAPVGQRSHVHSLAPLTHWPTRMSSGVLRLTWLLMCPRNALADCNAVVCFPTFDMRAGSLVTGSRQEPKADTLVAYPRDFAGKSAFSVDYADGNVRFVALSADPQQAGLKLKKDGLQLSQGSVSRSAVLAAFANHLLPLPMWLAWTRSTGSNQLAGADLQAGLLRVLWSALGFGREYDVGAAGRPNVLEFLVEGQSPSAAALLRATIEKGIAGGAITDATAVAAFRKSVAKLGAAPVSTTWTHERKSVWRALGGEFENTEKAVPLAPEAFRAAWAPLATRLATEDGLCEIMGVWLEAVLDPLFGVTPERQAWAPVREKLLRVGEYRRDLLMRALPFLGSIPQWEAVRQVAADMNRKTIRKLKDATQDAAKRALGKAALLPEAEMRRVVYASLDRFLRELRAASEADRPRPRDRGLKLDFSGWDDAAGAGSDQRLRGYAIGLCSGFIQAQGNQWEPDTRRAQWLTDTAVLMNKTWVLNDDKTIAWMHEAVGATATNGEKLVSVEYEGAPLATALASGVTMNYSGEDPDGFQCVDFAWKEGDRSLPLLGYGLYYAACATPLDNVGAVIDPDLRGAHVTELKAAKTVLAALQPVRQYLSSETPGAPECSLLDDGLYELSDETQAHAWQQNEIAKATVDPAARVPTLAKVALLAAPEAVKVGTAEIVLFPKVRASCSFLVAAPGTHSAFIERWLATDQLLIENGRAPSDSALGTNAAAVAAFAHSFREKEGTRPQRSAPPYHPAVSAIGIELVIPGEAPKRQAITIDRVVANKLIAAQDQINVDVVATASGSVRLIVSQKSVKLELPRGRFACLRFYSLVAEKHFKPGSSEQRYATGLNNSAGITFPGFRAFSPTERWFEALPAWPTAGLPKADVAVLLAPPSESTAGLLSPNLLVASIAFPKETRWTQWVKAAYLQRHEWHWTGYPVDFPGATADLDKWIPSLAGVESFREVIDSPFTTSFDGVDWRIGPNASGHVVVHRWSLAAGERPARYVAYLARPMLRYRPWLNPQLGKAGPFAVENDIYAGGAMVPGRHREVARERLAVPALRHGIPLTASYVPEQGLARGANGVLLVFDDAIRRTDDLAQVGGIGDTLEIDMVDTRIAGISEIGNNPIFHGAQLRLGQGSLAADPAFGLTFDIGPNPRVAQTAVVVRTRNAGGRWVMAMVRARRMILPETELATLLHPDATLQQSLPDHVAVIPTRVDGKDVVPIDFVVDVKAPLHRTLQLFSDGPEKLSLKIPAAKPEADLTYRYLVTWHKERWFIEGDQDSDAKWRCQVMLQVRRPDRLAWDTLPGTVRGLQQSESQLKPGLPIERWLLAIETAAAADAQVRSIRISDYTDPRWLTFIGSFGTEIPGMARDFRFVERNGALDNLELAPGAKVTLPTLRDRDASLAGSEPTFHLALLFRALPDAVRLRTEDGTGELVACYFVDSNKKPVFLPREAGDAPPANLAGCYAHVLTLQRISSMTDAERNKLSAATLADLLECAFPVQGDTAVESLLRILPEYLGPIPVLK